MVLAMAYQMFKLKSTNLVQIVVTETGDSFLMNFTDALIGFEIFNWSNCQVLSNVILLDVILNFEDILTAVVVNGQAGRHGRNPGLHCLLLWHEGSSGSGLCNLYPCESCFLEIKRSFFVNMENAMNDEFLGNFYKGVKIFNFSSEIIFVQLL